VASGDRNVDPFGADWLLSGAISVRLTGRYCLLNWPRLVKNIIRT
jgi:hypothetical protein